jgi:hypothetical protein
MDILVKYCPGIHNITCLPIARQRLGKHISATNAHATIEGYPLLSNESVNTVSSMVSDPRLYNEICLYYGCNETRVEAGSNTSTVTLRVVGGGGKGSLKTERVKYGREIQGTRTRERLRWRGPAAYTKDRPVLSSERAPHKTRP